MMSDQRNDDVPAMDPDTGFVDMSRYDDIDGDEESEPIPLADHLGPAPEPLPDDEWDAVIAHAVDDDDRHVD